MLRPHPRSTPCASGSAALATCQPPRYGYSVQRIPSTFSYTCAVDQSIAAA